jgi:hypothetical protein
MKCFLMLISVVAFTNTATSQVLLEDFSHGVPPADWKSVNNAHNSMSDGWSLYYSERAGYEGHFTWDYYLEDTLVSPAFDLVGVTVSTLTFLNECKYSIYMANHHQSIGDGKSDVRISTDGGWNWTELWLDTSTADGTYSVTVDLSAYDGMTGLRLGFHYFGTEAHSWYIDDVMIDGTGAGGGTPTLSSTPLIRGQSAAIELSHATIYGNALVAYSLTGPGPSLTRFGWVDLSPPITLLPMKLINAVGKVEISAGVPVQIASHTLYVQAIDLTQGVLSNSIAEPVL